MKCYSCRKYDTCQLDWKCSADMYFCSAYEVEQTNDEWLRSATFEELAGAIYEWHTKGYARGRLEVDLNPITEVVEWLKQPHTNE